MLCNAGSGFKFFWVLTKPHQSFGSCQKLGKMCCSALPRKSPKRMHWHCLSHSVCTLWLCRTLLGSISVKGYMHGNEHIQLASLKLCQAAYESSLSSRTLGYHIRHYIAWMTTKWPTITIHNTSHYCKIPCIDNHMQSDTSKLFLVNFWLTQYENRGWYSSICIKMLYNNVCPMFTFWLMLI